MSIYGKFIKPALRKVKASLEIPKGAYMYGKVASGVKATRLGSAYGSFDVVLDGLDENSVVYCFGIGEDISFDLAVIERCRCVVHAFDPTPRSLEWVQAQKPPENLVVHGFGLSNKDGTEMFFPPENESHISHSFVKKPTGAKEPIHLPVKTFESTAKELGHTKVDLLKMDIEGAEFLTLDGILNSGIAVGQIAIEFHEGMAGLRATRRQVARVKQAGYEVVAINREADTVTFLRVGRLSG